MRRMKKTLGLILFLTVVTTGIVAVAATLTGRLRSELEQNKFYKVVTIGDVNVDINLNQSNYEKEYKNQFVVMTGEARTNSLSSDGKKLTLYAADGNKVTVDVTDVTVPSWRSGDELTVFGKITDNWGDGYTLKADAILAHLNHSYAVGQAVSLASGGTVYDGVKITDKKLSFKIPESWNSSFVQSVEERNGTNVYQFSLNALEPLNTEYAEAFYAFYFTYETYLEGQPKNPSDNDKKTIEKEIVKNILQDTGAEGSIKIEGAKTVGSKSFHYYQTMATGDGSKDYRLEFVFVPDDNDAGTTCLLYLYFPSEGCVNHSEEVAYVVNSVLQ